MRTTILLSTLLILAGCSNAPQPQPQAEAKKGGGPGQVGIKEIDSPIVVTDGSSIDFKKHDGLLGLGTQEAKARVRNTKSLDLTIRNCDPTSNTCEVKLPGSWKLELHSVDASGNDSIATYMEFPFPDPQDPADVGIHISINPGPNNSTFALHDPIKMDPDYYPTMYPNGAPFLVQSAYQLTYIQFNPAITPVGSTTQVGKLNCTAPCKFVIAQK